MKKVLGLFLALVMVFTLVACGDDNEEVNTDGVEVKFNVALGNASRTITYNKTDPLTLSDGSVVSAGDLKPVWQYFQESLNLEFTDVTVQDQKASEMIDLEAATGFADATIYGGNSIAGDLMSYGTSGYFIDLKAEMEAGNLPNIKAYMDENPDVASAITAYDGGIYHIPYIAEVGNFARVFNLREEWVTTLLDDVANTTYDTDTTVPVTYEGFWTEDNGGLRTGANGGSVTPMTGTTVEKATNENVILLQNAAATSNELDGETAAEVLVQYIEDNYNYTNPSELFLGEKAAYDIDELAALFRAVKANPDLLTEGKADSVTPFFVRQTKYREDLLRLAMYFGGNQVFGSDSYDAKLVFDADGNVNLSYATEGFYDSLVFLNQWFEEGLIHQDFYNETDTSNFRTSFFGTDDADTPQFGFMTFDWIASTTSDSLNDDVVSVLPPVSEINGSWQYYVENSRVIKPDGWAISAAATDLEKAAALKVFDNIFSDEGHVVQNYGLLDDVELDSYVGPDGVTYPEYKDWLIDTAAELNNGDVSSFLRDWMGSHIPIGYAKEIGFEYQYTSQRGFDGWALYANSTTNITTYAGEGIDGPNDYFYKLTPPVFSLNELQSETISDNVALDDAFYEIVFSIVRAGLNDSELDTPANYQEYLQEFKDAGLDTYENVYNQAYDAMTE